MLSKLGLRDITIRQFSRVNFTHTVLSKRKLQFFVDQGLVTGWVRLLFMTTCCISDRLSFFCFFLFVLQDDPALPTVRGILRRGLSAEALRLFILSQGASVSRTNMSM